MLKKVLYNWLYPACAFFTLFVLSFLIIATAASKSTAFIAALTLENLATFVLLALALTLINKIFSIPKLNTVLKVTLHFICFIVSFGAVFWAFGRSNEAFSPSVMILFMLMLSVVYFIIMFVYLLLRGAYSKKASESQSYSQLYKK